MRKIFTYLLIAASLSPVVAFAYTARTITNPASNSPLDSSIMRNELQLLENEITTVTNANINGMVGPATSSAPLMGRYMVATSTLIASVFPLASTTAVTATTFCFATDCRTSWPAGGSYTAFTPLSVNAQNVFAIATSSASQSGFLSAADYQLLHVATTTFSSPLSYSGATNAVTCPTCNTSSATVTSVATTWPVLGGTITTSGTISFDGLSTTSPWTTGNLVYVNSGKLLTSVATSSTGTAGAVVALNASQFTTVPSASSTHFTAGTSLQIPNGSSQAPTVAGYLAQDTTDNQLVLGITGATSVFDSRRFMTFTYATTTTMTGTTTLSLGTTPIAGTITKAQCYTDAGTMNVQAKYGAGPTNIVGMFNASTTIGTITFTGSNTPAAGNAFKVDIGTPASSPTIISCTFTFTVTGT